jgi:hypothetical protein
VSDKPSWYYQDQFYKALMEGRVSIAPTLRNGYRIVVGPPIPVVPPVQDEPEQQHLPFAD